MLSKGSVTKSGFREEKMDNSTSIQLHTVQLIHAMVISCSHTMYKIHLQKRSSQPSKST